MKKTKENKHSLHFDAYSPVVCNNIFCLFIFFTPFEKEHMFNMAAQSIKNVIRIIQCSIKF